MTNQYASLTHTHAEMLEECAMEPKYRIEAEGDEIKIFRWMVIGGNMPATKPVQKDRDEEIALYTFGGAQIYNGSFAELEHFSDLVAAARKISN